MNTKTGELKRDEELTDQDRASGDWMNMQLTPAQAQAIEQMTPSERIEFAAKYRNQRNAEAFLKATATARTQHRWEKRQAFDARVRKKRREELGLE